MEQFFVSKYNLITLTSKPASKGGDWPGSYRPLDWFMSEALIPTYLNRI